MFRRAETVEGKPEGGIKFMNIHLFQHFIKYRTKGKKFTEQRPMSCPRNRRSAFPSSLRSFIDAQS